MMVVVGCTIDWSRLNLTVSLVRPFYWSTPPIYHLTFLVVGRGVTGGDKGNGRDATEFHVVPGDAKDARDAGEIQETADGGCVTRLLGYSVTYR